LSTVDTVFIDVAAVSDGESHEATSFEYHAPETLSEAPELLDRVLRHGHLCA
jgi:hypothetical protein